MITTARAENINCISGTPTFWRSFLSGYGSAAATIPLEIATLGGEITDQSILDQIKQIWPHVRLTHIYASTEAGAVFAIKDGKAGFPASWLTTGVDGVALKITDDELIVQSPRTMTGYLSPANNTAQAPSEWLATGDLCTVQNDRVIFTGRRDNLINVGGVKIAPEPIETLLLNCPQIRDVRVYGKRNPITGMVIAADIVCRNPDDDPDATRQAVVAYARTHLRPDQQPHIIHVIPDLSLGSGSKKVRQ